MAIFRDTNPVRDPLVKYNDILQDGLAVHVI